MSKKLSNHEDSCFNIVLAGNPNVGKSTVFNELTGLKQHTGNWAGKTVDLAYGFCDFNGRKYRFTDVPGTYSLLSHSHEEKVARNKICFSDTDCVVIVCDASCLERNLNLVLQILEITSKAVVCVNLYEEARKKKVYVNCDNLSSQLGVSVIPTEARKGKGITQLMKAVEKTVLFDNQRTLQPRYIKPVEDASKIISGIIPESCGLNQRWLALRLIENNPDFISSLKEFAPLIFETEGLEEAVNKAQHILIENGISKDNFIDRITSCLVLSAEGIASECVSGNCNTYSERERTIDRIMTNKITAVPVMIFFFIILLWITIYGANYPSGLLMEFFDFTGIKLREFLIHIDLPANITSLIMDGMYKVLTWVIAVMLPPMAIFFPLFTLLEDFGFLPRIAFNLDKFFNKASACGKQALTMAMGFGCNACGVSGCRIIDSPRERIIAILTNVFVPCNGRFPSLIMLISMFLISGSSGFSGAFASAAILTAVIILGIAVTLLVSKLLSKTILKGMPASFTLELPPYRCPQIGKTLMRSFLDRTLFVLGRAASAAAPAGIVIWLLANTFINGISVLHYCTDFLDPFGRLLGMDGVILFAFVLGFPANEIVIPIIIMCYLSSGTLIHTDNLNMIHELFIENGWTVSTAISTILFSLMHFPCATTCITIYKETSSVKWTVLSVIIPTAIGFAVCFLFTQISAMVSGILF